MTMMVLAKFINVGRNKKCWEERVSVVNGAPNYSALFASIRRHHAILSREIDIDDNGNIWAGMRCVGRITLAALEGEANA